VLHKSFCSSNGPHEKVLMMWSIVTYPWPNAFRLVLYHFIEIQLNLDLTDTQLCRIANLFVFYIEIEKNTVIL